MGGALAAATSAAGDPVIVTLAPYVVAVVAVVGAVASAILTNRQSHTSWIRANRLETYTEYLDVSNEMWKRMVDYADRADRTTHDEVQKRDIAALGAQCDRAVSKIKVLGTPAASSAAVAFFATLAGTENIVCEGAPDGPRPDWNRMRAAHNRFAEVAQAAIKSRD